MIVFITSTRLQGLPKIVYVAMSLHIYLLCFAIHQDRFDKIKNKLTDWEIVNLKVIQQ